MLRHMAQAQATNLLNHLPGLAEHLHGHFHHAIRQEVPGSASGTGWNWMELMDIHLGMGETGWNLGTPIIGENTMGNAWKIAEIDLNLWYSRA